MDNDFLYDELESVFKPMGTFIINAYDPSSIFGTLYIDEFVNNYLFWSEKSNDEVVLESLGKGMVFNLQHGALNNTEFTLTTDGVFNKNGWDITIATDPAILDERNKRDQSIAERRLLNGIEKWVRKFLLDKHATIVYYTESQLKNYYFETF